MDGEAHWLRWGWLLALVAVSVSCSSGERPTLPDENTLSGSEQAQLDADSVESANDDDMAVLDQDLRGEQISAPAEDLLAVITPTGILAPVIGKTPTRYQVTTPCGVEAFVSRGHPVSAVQVVLDPGHGGSEPGAADASGLTEADLNLQVARGVAAVLLDRGIVVAVTRTGDYRIPIQQRAAIADQLQAEVFVSIHHNSPASRTSTTPGTEVYVQSGSDDSARLGGLLHEEVLGALSQFDVEWSARDDAGVLVVLDDEGDDAYGIVRRPLLPTALVELAYLGNPEEVVLLRTEAYVSAASEAVAEGIERYLATVESGTALNEAPRVFNPSAATGGVDNCVDPRLE